MRVLGYMYGALLICGFCLVFIPPVVAIAQKKKLSKEEFGLQLFTPQLIGFILLMIGMSGTLSNYYNDTIWQMLITFMAIGAIFNSVVAGCQSIIIQRWRAD